MPDTFGFLAIPSVNKALATELARCEYIQRRENVIALGYSSTGKTPSPSSRDERRRLNLQRQISRLNPPIIDELGCVPPSRTGAELLFKIFSKRYERGSILVTTNLPFDEWGEVSTQ